ncbi:DUF3667 domain-containing protein [Mucilaginibacter sp. MD40]|uniref:DUF3667 domain-containing protein n=1 Tax=Mucilaginibacter sp. MD40 TaxID=2029590 RepID=UPI001E2AA0A8|nr:DUF3667 domain-containing protein [Mucilaginibacter sp. MD40]
MINCGHCHTEIAYNYCPQCGQPAKLKRIDAHYIQHEVLHVLHFEKGIFYTIRELLIRPGRSVHIFMAENRSRLIKPVLFITLSSLLYTIISHFFHIEEGYVSMKGMVGPITTSINNWIQNHYGYANIIMGIFIALWLKVFFRKSGYNFFEILILLCFIEGVGMLLFSVFAIVEGITNYKLMAVSSALSAVYISWGIGQFFNRAKLMSYVKALIAYLLGMLTFSIIVFAIGLIGDQFLKH